MKPEEKRPPLTSMEGMIWNANHVLERALDPGINGLPKGLFEKCKALVMITVVEVGYIWTGSVGSGIMLAKQADGSWSKPSACGLAGCGWGFIVGGSWKDVMVFIFDDATLKGYISEEGIRLGGEAEITLGVGRNFQLDTDFGTRGSAGGTMTIAFTTGAFIGVGVEGGVLSVRPIANQKFYGESLSPRQILMEGKGHIPAGKVTLLDDVYTKLDLLTKGTTHTPTAADKEKKEEAFTHAEKEVYTGEGAVHVNAQEEHEKEQNVTA